VDGQTTGKKRGLSEKNSPERGETAHLRDAITGRKKFEGGRGTFDDVKKKNFWSGLLET